MKMNKTLLKVVAALVIFAFTFNEMAYGMSPAFVSGSLGDQLRKGTRDDMRALGEKLFAARKGPGSIDFDAPVPRTFKGSEPYLKGVRRVETDWENLPAGWENNPILAKTDIVDAFEYFRRHEARIPADRLKI